MSNYPFGWPVLRCLPSVVIFTGHAVIVFSRLLFLSLVTLSCTPVVAQTRIVELTVFAGPGNQTGAQQKWMRVLSGVGADRVKSVIREDVRPTIDEEEFGGSTIVSVKGVLKNGRLLLPGGKFATSDAARIKEYLQKLRDDKVDVALADKKAFGLTAQQLAQVHEILSRKISASTVGLTPAEAVRLLVKQTNMQVQMATDVKARLNKGKALVDEREGLSAGTALASILRESGLGLMPKRPQGGSIEFHLVGLDFEKDSSQKDVWPIGWPSENPPVALEPRLFQRQDIRIERFPLSDALAAVSKRCGARVLYDRAEILNRHIDLAATEVSFARKQVTYMVTFGKLLRQSDPPLDIEVRVDEAGQPFAWIGLRR
ncbi:hypothetical protein N9L06_02425 [Mariniblastus sp.]|nr:hypothetical protein [Mariniblastus sp.]